MVKIWDINQYLHQVIFGDVVNGMILGFVAFRNARILIYVVVILIVIVTLTVIRKEDLGNVV